MCLKLYECSLAEAFYVCLELYTCSLTEPFYSVSKFVCVYLDRGVLRVSKV